MDDKRLYVTLDTEMDSDVHWNKSWPPKYSSVLEGIPKLLRPIWDKYDVHPIYFVSPEILCNEDCCNILREEIKKGAIIGTHLHGEYIEPNSKCGQSTETFKVPFPCLDFDTETETQKLENLTHLIEEKFGIKPEWYRAARFGADYDTIKILKKLGYKYDSSVTPNTDWSNKGGPNHSLAPRIPYQISEEGYYKGKSLTGSIEPSECDTIIEVPVTILGKRWGLLGKMIPNNWLFYRWLRPTHMTYIEMKQIIKQLSEEHTLVMMFHSMEIMVRKTPYVRWKWMQRYYLFRLDRAIGYAVKKGFDC